MWCQNVRYRTKSERDKRKHQSQEKKYSLDKQTDVYGSLLEGKRHHSLAKPDKIQFLNEPKQTKLANQKHGVITMHTNIHVTFDMSFATPQSNSSALHFLKSSSVEHSI